MSTLERTYLIAGMTCGHCELSVQEEVSELAGVADAAADHVTGRLVVRGSSLDDDAVRRAVEAAGYELSARE